MNVHILEKLRDGVKRKPNEYIGILYSVNGNYAYVFVDSILKRFDLTWNIIKKF